MMDTKKDKQVAEVVEQQLEQCEDTDNPEKNDLSDVELEQVAGGGVPEIMGLQSGGESGDDPWWQQN